MIKAILFDVDGVLIQTELATAELERRYGIPQSQSQEFFEREWDKCILGKADSKQLLEPYLKKWGWPSSVNDYLKFWFDFENKQDAKLLEYIQGLRARKIECFLATNQDIHRARYILEEMGFAQAFDGAFISSHLGHAKPSREFFVTVLDELPYLPEEILFWDDIKDNIVAASAAGINAELYTTESEFATIMEKKYGL